MILENLQNQFTEEIKNNVSSNSTLPAFLTNEERKLSVFLTHPLDKEEPARVFGVTYDI
jgi:hypothetical protein